MIQRLKIVPKDAPAPDIHHMLMLIAEAKVALSSLTELMPNPEAVRGLTDFIRDALDTLAAGLAPPKR